MAKSFVGKLAVSAADVASLSASFASLTDAGGSAASISSGMVAVIAISADKGGGGNSLSITGFTRRGNSTDANPVSAIFTRTLDGTETTISFADSASNVEDVSVAITVWDGIDEPTTWIRSSGSGLGDPDNIEVTDSSQMVIATGHVDDIAVTDLGPPSGMTLAVAAVYNGGSSNSSTTGIAYDLTPGAGFYNPGEFTGTGSDSDDAYIAVADEAASSSDDVTLQGVTAGTPTIGQVTVGQVHDITLQGVLASAAVIGAMTVGQVHNVTLQDVTSSVPTIGQITASVSDNATLQDVTAGVPTIGQITVGQIHDVSLQDVTAGVPTISQITAVAGTGVLLQDVVAGVPVIDPITADNAVTWVTEDYDNNTNTTSLGDGLRWNYNLGYDDSGNKETDNEHALQRGSGDANDLLKFEIRGGEGASSDDGDERGRAELSG